MPAIVDVLIPIYNGGVFVRGAIRSIQDQTERNIRIIVVDDGSTDCTSDILKELAANDSRIEVISKTNSGIVDALNIGLKASTAEFLARHDADDIAYPNRLEVQLRYLQENPDCAALGCRVQHIDENGHFMGTIGDGAKPERADPSFVPAQEPYIIHPFLIARREALQAIGGYRYVHHAEDTDLYWRLQEVDRLHNLDDILGQYRIHSGSVSGASLANARVQALSAQLSAISALRRRSSRPDLDFTRDAIARHKEASGSLAALLDEVTVTLTLEESKHLKAATSAKLLELATYRPYEVSSEDCAYISVAIRSNLKNLSDVNRSLLIRYVSGTVARLASAGKWGEASALAWVELWPSTLWRFLLRVLLPPGLRNRLKRFFFPARMIAK